MSVYFLGRFASRFHGIGLCSCAGEAVGADRKIRARLQASSSQHPTSTRIANTQTKRSSHAGCTRVERPATIHQNVVSRGRPSRSGMHTRNQVLDELWSPNAKPRHLVSAPPFIAPLILLLKSGTVLKAVGAISKLSLVLAATLRFSGRRILMWWHGEYHPLLQVLADGQTTSKNSSSHRHFRRTTLLLVVLPFGLFGVVVLASLEYAPIWGRWRIIAMSADEEQEILYESLRPGLQHAIHAPPTREGRFLEANYDRISSRNWLAILRSASGDEEAGSPQGFFSGYRVVREDDWRVRWVADVLRRLDDAIADSALSTTVPVVATFSPGDENSLPSTFHIPPVKYSLSIRPALLKRLTLLGLDEPAEVTGPLTRHGNVIIDAPICNVCSIGFGTALKRRTRTAQNAFGIVVVTTGLLDEILGPDLPPEIIEYHIGPFSFERTISRPSRKSATPEETNQLAAILAHELSHILLAHYLETRASRKLFELFETVFTDFTQMALYPITRIFGPVLSDWLCERISAKSASWLNLEADWESRTAETEADLLGMRILVAARFDPRVSLRVWGEEGVFHRVERKQTVTAEAKRASEDEFLEVGDHDEKSWLDRNVLVRNHPLSDRRYLRIKEELKRWQEGAGDVLGESPAGFLD